MLRIPSTSKIYLKAAVVAVESGTAQDPTGDVVEVAITTTNPPSDSDWHTASWETDATTTPPTYKARLMVGPGGAVQLTGGTVYQMYTRVTDNPEVPVLHAGPVQVY